MFNLNWWGSKFEYDIGDEPSAYIQNRGKEFLAQYITEGDTIADFGVWAGRNLPVLLSLTKHVVATDVLEARAAVAKAKERNLPGVKFFETPLAKLPFADGSIAGGLCWRVLHNLIDAEEVIAALLEINRVLKTDAPLLMAVRAAPEEKRPRWWNPKNSYIHRRTNGAGDWREDIYFTGESLQLLLTLMGFELIYCEPIKENEKIGTATVNNSYLAAHILKKKSTIDHEWIAMVHKLIVKFQG